MDHNNQQHQGEYVEFAKRLQKAFVRKTVDYYCHFLYEKSHPNYGIKQIPSYTPALPNFSLANVPPHAYANVGSAICTRFIHTAINKFRSPIGAITFYPDGRRLITASNSGELTLWNSLTFNFETIQQAHEASIKIMRWSYNDNFLLIGDQSGIIKYFQQSLNNIKIIKAHDEPVRGIGFSPSDTKFVSGSDDKTVKIFDFASGVEESSLTGHGWDIKTVDWHPHSSLIASGSKDNLVKLWDARSSKCLMTLHAHKNTVHVTEFNKNGFHLLTGSKDQLLKLWDIRTGKELQTFKDTQKDVSVAKWHPVYENMFASATITGDIFYWSTSHQTPIGFVNSAHDQAIWTMDWHPLGHVLATGSNDCATRFWSRSKLGEDDPIR